MKKIFLSVLLLWLCLPFLQAQNQPLPQNTAPRFQYTLTYPVYHIWTNESSRKKRYLWSVTDTTMTLGTRQDRPNIGMSTYPVEQIEWIKVRKKGRVLLGMKIGVLVGVLTGIVMGYAEGDDKCGPGNWCIISLTAEQKAFLYSAYFVPIGATAGGLIGSIKTKIPINGSRSTLAQQRKVLEQYRVGW